MNITIVLGTARTGRNSERVYLALQEMFPKNKNANVTSVDVRDYVQLPQTIPSWGEGGADTKESKWKTVVKDTDAFVFILPEYNHSFPGEWKLLVDTLSKEYSGKTAYIVGVSSGVFAGVRVSDHVKTVLIELNFSVPKVGLYIGKVADVITEQGTINDEALKDRIAQFVDAVAQKS